MIRVTAMTHRANRIFWATIPGPDCNEVCFRDRLMARIFLPLLKLRIPELVEFDLPLSGGARHLAILAIRKTYAGQAHQVATAAWGLRPFWFARLLVVVDAEVDVRDAGEVWAAIAQTRIWCAMSGCMRPRGSVRSRLPPGTNSVTGWQSTPRGNLRAEGHASETSQCLHGSRRRKAGHRPLGPVWPGTRGGSHESLRPTIRPMQLDKSSARVRQMFGEIAGR